MVQSFRAWLLWDDGDGGEDSGRNSSSVHLPHAHRRLGPGLPSFSLVLINRPTNSSCSQGSAQNTVGVQQTCTDCMNGRHRDTALPFREEEWETQRDHTALPQRQLQPPPPRPPPGPHGSPAGRSQVSVTPQRPALTTRSSAARPALSSLLPAVKS